MIIKLNLLEMTFEQRRNTAQLLLTYPPAVPLIGIDDRPVKEDAFVVPTEEQRLDAEQKRDMSGLKEIRESGDNLNAIFGAPTDDSREFVAVAGAIVTEIFGEPGKVVVLPDEGILKPSLDAQGLPWDSRIHASTKTFIADGTWKLRRGVDPAEVEKVKAQLKELMAVPVEVTQPVHNTGHVDLDPSSRIPIPPKSHYLIDQQPEVIEIPMVRPPATVTLTDLIARMSAAIVAGKLTQGMVAEMCAKHGVSEFMLLSNRPDLLPLIDVDMKDMGV